MSEQGKFAQLNAALRAGHITRREFMARSTALGVAGGVAMFCANAAEMAASGRSLKNGFALYAQEVGDKRPDAGTENQQRGEGGDLRMIQWQAPTSANAHRAVGTKESLAASIVQEPLLSYLPDGKIIPNLVKEVPTVENGLLAEDLSSVTFNLLEGVTWSDGQPFTANDVVFTWQWVTTPENQSTSVGQWDVLENVEAQDDLTVVATYKNPSVAWFTTWTGVFGSGVILPAHVFNNDPANSNQEYDTNPIGTGPFVVESFQPNAEAVYVANENYREPNKPFFARVILTGGGDAAAAARSVLETGEAQFAWNIQVEPQILEEMEASGGQGTMLVEPGTSIERININFSDPNTEVNGQRSEMNTPHPILSDLKVRQALNVAIPRDVIANEFYGEGQPATANILTGSPEFTSENTSWEFNLERAAQLLDEAGWTMQGDVRVKDGREFQLSYATSINQVRQKTQAVIQQAMQQIGIRLQLQQIDANVYFDASAGNEQNINHFYWDIDEYANSSIGSPMPTTYMLDFYAGADDSNSNIAQESNGWSGQNYWRYKNEEYDALYEQLIASTDVEAAWQLLIQMNDIVINDVVVIPMVQRAGINAAVANTLNKENIAVGATYEPDYWNIANWNNAQ
ncbi:MAG: peptide ABC transporter substrate-binding protein [Chloroflexota bacterium]|nr:peptide ABC transporter substrate-binding protein [Chloroflexota bacterium]